MKIDIQSAVKDLLENKDSAKVPSSLIDKMGSMKDAMGALFRSVKTPEDMDHAIDQIEKAYIQSYEKLGQVSEETGFSPKQIKDHIDNPQNHKLDTYTLVQDLTRVAKGKMDRSSKTPNFTVKKPSLDEGAHKSMKKRRLRSQQSWSVV